MTSHGEAAGPEHLQRIINEGKVAPRRKKTQKFKLYHWNDLPDYLKDNEFIFSGYRANAGVWGSLSSLFRVHNESGNVWSHLTGFLLFMFLLAFLVRSPPTPLAMHRQDLEKLWDSVAARINNASDSVRRQIDIVDSFHLHQAPARASSSEGPVRPTAGGQANDSASPAIFSSKLRSLQHSLVESMHELEGRLVAGIRLPPVKTLRTSLSSVQHKLHDGLESVQHTLQEGLASVQHTLRDGLESLVEGVHLPEAVSAGMRHLGEGVNSSWARLPGSVAHGLHNLQDFVTCRLQIFKGNTTRAFSANVGERIHRIHDLVDEMLHRVVLSSVRWPVPRWPIYVFMGGVMACLFLSTIAHLFGCCNEHVAATIWRFDYAGIVANIVSSFYPSVYYSFMCQPVYQWLYLLSITICGFATLMLSLLGRFQTVRWRGTRASAFAILALQGIVPYLHIVIAYPGFDKLWEVVAIDILMAFFYLAGAAIYALRVPERWAPGKFDLVLHSHQIFHLCVVAGAYSHFVGVLELLRWRDASGGCALEVVDREMVRHAVLGGEGLVDVHVVVAYLQRRMHEFFNLPYSVVCRADHEHDNFMTLLPVEYQTCPWVH